ncbi:MAG: hypothetical protein PHC51_03745 [bacterium]|nr:hypothetical protein [bacterium]
MKQEELNTLLIAPVPKDAAEAVEELSLPSSLLDPKLVRLLEERFIEAQRCLPHSPLATIILCGSLLEGLLIGLANKKPADFNRSTQSPKDQRGKSKDFKDWSLEQFINVAHDLGIVRQDVKQFGQTLRNFRNYIHPYQQMKEDFNPDRYTAEICLIVVKAAVNNINITANPKAIEISSVWTHHPDATCLTQAILIGSWNEKSECDREAITELLGVSYDAWLKKAREILHTPDSPLSLKNGIWKVGNRVELWRMLGSRILDNDLDTFRSIALRIMTESDPIFELPADDRSAASIYGKVLKSSKDLRKGIAEGLAIIGSYPEVCKQCSPDKTETICASFIRELFEEADWKRWGSVNDLLPILAEVAPTQFLDAVEFALKQSSCPFVDLFNEEDGGIFGRNYLTGLLWALEGLAWDEQYLVRVCVALADLASHDPGGNWDNRPFNSLTAILLPWFPQTLAGVEKRQAAVQTILRENPDIAWNLINKLLPGQRQISSGSHKPIWRQIIPDDWGDVTTQEYWQQATFYAELAVETAGEDTARLSALIDHFDHLPKSAFDQLLDVLASLPIAALPEEQRLLIWDHLAKFTNKHRRFSDAKWALSDELITRIEQVAELLAPTNPFNLYQHLFTDRDFDLYEEDGDWEEQRKKLDTRRETAISEIFQQDCAEGLIRFAESVSAPRQVGHALGAIADSIIERTFLPHFLDSADDKHTALVSGFIWRSHLLKGWEWCDDIDKSDWSPEQVGQFLACLPFIRGAWDRASEWLQAKEREYWTRTGANAYQADGDLEMAVEKLLEYGRPHAAIGCLDKMRHAKQPIDSSQCVRALLAALSSNEPRYVMDEHDIVELIQFLQAEPSVNEEDLFRVEWAYVSLLDHHRGAAPQLLESRLANDPEFFCEVIRLIYRSKNEDPPLTDPTEEKKAIAANAWRLLHQWKTPPGTQKDGTFSEESFIDWLKRVKEVCTESGHLEVALSNIGEVLIHTPPHPDGLWIHRTVADALNDREADNMRAGFRTGIYNSRGVRWVDPTGKPEREFAEQFRIKAEKVENAGFQRFAAILRGLAEGYDREARRVIAENEQEGE